MTRLLARLTCLALLAPIAVRVAPAAAQDTNQVNEGVRVGVEYQPGVQPGLVVLPGAGLDSVRAIVGRDLDYTDRFRVIILRDVASTSEGRGGAEGAGVNYGIYRTLGAEFGVELTESAGAVTVRLHDLNAGRVRNQQSFTLPPATDPGYRLEVHRMADEVARWATGTPGIAASRLLLVSGGRVYRIDSDGEALTPLTPAGQTALSPAWSPDGGRIAYTLLGQGRGPVVVQSLGSGAAMQVPGTATALNITPTFSPDGRLVAYAHSDENGTDVYLANVADRCCAQRLTVGRFADNLSPTFSPDGRRIAFVSTRATRSCLRRSTMARPAAPTHRNGPLTEPTSCFIAKSPAVRSSFSSTCRDGGSGSSPRPVGTKIRRGVPTAGTSLSSPTGAVSGSSGSSTSKPAACAS
jgi:TolB protein